MTIADVASVSEAIRKLNHQKFVTGAGQIHVSVELEDEFPSLSAVVEGSTYRISDYAEKSLLRVTGVNRKFIANTSHDVQCAEAAINESLRGLAGDRGTRIHVTAASDEIQAFSSAPARMDAPPTLLEVWNTLQEVGGDTIIGGEVTELGRGEFDLRVVTDHGLAPKNRVGDITNTGVSFHLGLSVDAFPFTNRLVCTNGMTRQTKGSKYSYVSGDSGSIRSIFQDALQEAKEFNELIQATDEVVLPNIHNYIAQALTMAGATAALKAQVGDLVAQDAPNRTLWEALQIITRIARDHAADRPRKRKQIEAIAGSIVDMQSGSGRCGSCNTRITGVV
jgi:hypothetical protein